MTEELDLTGFGDERDLEGSQFLGEGKFHVAITVVNTQPLDYNREPLDGKEIGFQGLAGTAPAVNRVLSDFFPNPSPSHKDGGKFCAKKLARLALATGLIHPADLGQRKQIDWNELVGRQLVIGVKVERYDRKDKSGQPTGEKGEKSRLNGLEIWSVYDPAVADVPKDAEMLELAAAQFAKPAGNGPAKPAAAAPRQQPVAAAATSDPYADV